MALRIHSARALGRGRDASSCRRPSRATCRCCGCSRATRSPCSTARTTWSGRPRSSASAATRSSCASPRPPAWSSASCRSPSPWRSASRPTSAWTRLVEKATELGAAAVQPLVCERSVVRLAGERAEARQRHWQAVAASASEQCGRVRVPRIAVPIRFDAWLRELDAAAGPGARWVLSLADGARRPAALHDPTRGDSPRRRSCVLSGPEGGLAPEEEAAAAAPAASCRSRSARARCAPTPRRWRCSPGSAWRTAGATNEPRPAAAGPVPGLLPDQQRHLHRHQRPGRPAPGAECLAGDAADHRLRRRRRPVRRPGRPAPARLGPAARVPARRCVVAMATTALCAWAAGRATSGARRRRDARRLLQRQRRPVPLRRHRAGRAAVQGAGDLLGAGRRHPRRRRRAEPGAQDPRRLLPAEFAGAYAALALVALASLVTISFIRFPPLVLPTPAAPGRRLARDRGPAGVHRRRRRLAPSATAS